MPTFTHFLNLEIEHIIYALTLLVVGYTLAIKTSHLVNVNMQKRFSKHHSMLVSRSLYYFIFLMFLISALNEIGFKLTVLLGTAGVFTVVLSFASQTAASNIISGIFLLFERPFKVGDTIVVKDVKGTVETMEWMATKIKTNDNLMVRIPNETLIKSDITNWTTMKIKRDDLKLAIGFHSVHEIQNVKQLILTTCKKNEYVLAKPAPKIEVTQLIDNQAMELNISYWTQHDLGATKDLILTDLMELIEKKQLVLYKDKEKN
jgi:small conductance mechanosensitive channel